MATDILWTDSFDSYTSNTFLYKDYLLTFQGNGSVTPIIGATGRRGTNGLKMPSLGSVGPWQLERSLPNVNNPIVGFAYKYDYVLDNTGLPIIAFVDGSSYQLVLRLYQNGTISVTRNTTVLGTSTFQLTFNTYCYIEFKAVIHNTTGSYDVKVNGISILSGTNVNTRNTANAYINRLFFGSKSVINPTGYYDDLYLGTGDTFLGDVAIDCLLPNAAGTTTQWTPSAGSNYQNVDETSINSDTDYNSSQTPGQIDLYNLSNISNTNVIHAINWKAATRKDNAGSRTIRRIIRSGGTNYEGSDIPVLDDYNYTNEILSLNPDTGLAWTESDINALEAGIKLQS